MNRSLKRKVLLLLFFVTAIKRKYLKKKKKYDTLNCFLSDIKWIEEMINQSSPVKKRLQDEGSFTAQHDSPPPTTLPGATPPAAPPSITQPDLSQTTTGPVLLPPTAQPDLTPPTIQPVLPQPTTRPDLPSPSTQQVLPQPTTQQVLPPPTTQPDSPPPSTHPYSPPPSTQPDSSLPSTQHDSPPPSTQPDSPPPSTQPDLVGQLSEFERKLLTEQEVMTVRGKTGRGVPVILPAITKAPLSYLTDSSVRSACGISSKNVYVFAGKGEGVIRAYNSVLKACSRAPLKSPQLITSTNLRKYMATVTQVFDLKPNEMNWVLDHLGHSMDVHKIHYRASSEILEKTQIAKLLLLQDSNQIGKYKNMSLKDIQIEDLVMDDQVQSPVTEDFDKQVFEESQMDSDCEEIKDKRKPAVSIKVKWTPEEDEEIKQLFKKCILKKKRPSPKDCQKALERSKLNGGVLWKRKKDVLKKKMFRLIDKLNKN